MRGLKLSVKLPLLFLLATAFAAVAAVWLIVSLGGDMLKAQALAANTNSVQTYASAISLYLDNARSVLESTADLPAITDSTSAQSVDPALRGLPAGVDAPKRNVAALLLEHSKVFEHVMLLRADGSVYLLEPYELQVKSSRPDLAFTAWYREVMSTGKTVVSDLHISTATQRPTVVIATPVFGPSTGSGQTGQIIGVWAGALTLGQFSQVGRSGLESGTPQRYGYVTDGRGLVIGHQTESKYVQDQTDFSWVPPVRAALAGQQGEDQFVDPIDRAEKLAAYMPLLGTKWAVVYEVPLQVAFAPIVDLARAIGLVGLGATVLVVLASVAISRQITVPLGRLAAAAEAIGAGDLTRRMEVTSGDELGRLADEFNHMAAALGRRMADLTALNAMAAIVNESLDVDEILNRALDEALRQVGVEAGAVLLLDEEAGELALVAHRGISEDFARAAQRLKLGEGLAGRAAQTGQPVVMGEVDEYPGALKAFVEKDRIQSVAGVPLLGRTGVIGVMNLVTRNPHYFDAAGLELLTSLGRQIAVGMEKAHLHEAVQRELAERKQAEDEVLRLNAELEQRVRERTAELEAANHELEAFSYSVSHDLRAPLRAIQGFSRVLAEDHAARLDAEGHRVLGVVTESTRQMGELIDDLLRFARISRQEIEPAVIDMTRLARLVVAECRELEPDRDVTVTINPLPVARGDQPMIRQALANLVSNAFKFTRPRPDARIEIGGEEGPTETTYLVRDNGVGFDPRYADQLFKVFQRLHSSKEFEGTGIGLAIVARVAHRHGGRVWADGIEGTGATFAFALPRKGGTSDA